MSNIENHVRIKTSQYLRRFFIKDRCEVCGTEDALHLHHVEPFVVMLHNTLSDLGYPYHNSKDRYTQTQLKNITNNMLGAQLQTYYLTLCEQHHRELHSNEAVGGEEELEGVTKYYKEKQMVNEILEKEQISNIIIPYLQSIENTKLYKQEQSLLKEVVSTTQLKRRTFGSLSFNRILKERNVPYEITLGKRKSYREGGQCKKGRSHWIVRRTDCGTQDEATR